MPDTSKYITRAESEVKRRNYDGAMDLYAEILQIDPDCGDARAGTRRAALKKLEKRYPSAFILSIVNLPSAFLLGMAGLFKAQNWTVNLCESALRRDPRNASLNAKLGRALLTLGYQDSALAAFRVVTEFDAKNLEALKTLGQLLYQRKELEEAIACYEKALKINPRDQEANKMRKNLAAEGAIQKGGFEQAKSARDLAKSSRQLKEAERASRIVRTSADISEAIEELEEAIEKEPDDRNLLMKLASLLVQQLEIDKAVDTYLQVLRLSPEDSEAKERLGDARIRRLEIKIQDAEKDVKSGADGAEDSLRRVKREHLNLQIEEFERRVELHPTDLSLRFRLGRAQLQDGRIDESIEQFQQAVKDPRNRVSALHMLGRAFARKGITDLAVKQYQEAADSIGSMNSHRKEILYELAQVCEKSGSSEDALVWYKKIYEADIGYRDVAPRIEALSG